MKTRQLKVDLMRAILSPGYWIFAYLFNISQIMKKRQGEIKSSFDVRNFMGRILHIWIFVFYCLNYEEKARRDKKWF